MWFFWKEPWWCLCALGRAGPLTSFSDPCQALQLIHLWFLGLSPPWGAVAALAPFPRLRDWFPLALPWEVSQEPVLVCWALLSALRPPPAQIEMSLNWDLHKITSEMCGSPVSYTCFVFFYLVAFSPIWWLDVLALDLHFALAPAGAVTAARVSIQSSNSPFQAFLSISLASPVQCSYTLGVMTQTEFLPSFEARVPGCCWEWDWSLAWHASRASF